MPVKRKKYRIYGYIHTNSPNLRASVFHCRERQTLTISEGPKALRSGALGLDVTSQVTAFIKAESRPTLRAMRF